MDSFHLETFQAYRLLHETPGLPFKNATQCSHCIYMLCMDLQTVTSALYNISR